MSTKKTSKKAVKPSNVIEFPKPAAGETHSPLADAIQGIKYAIGTKADEFLILGMMGIAIAEAFEQANNGAPLSASEMKELVSAMRTHFAA